MLPAARPQATPSDDAVTATSNPRPKKKDARDDDEDLLKALRRRMPVALSASEFRKLGEVDSAAALLSAEHPPPVTVRDPPLYELTAKALEILSRDEDGFFLMVEGGRIDHACHANDIRRSIHETIEFAETVQPVSVGDDW